MLCEILTGCRYGLDENESPGELIKQSQRLKRAASRSHSEHLQGEAFVVMVVDLLRLGRIHDAQREMEEHRAYATRNQRPLALYVQRTFDSTMALWEGEFTRAQDLSAT